MVYKERGVTPDSGATPLSIILADICDIENRVVSEIRYIVQLCPVCYVLFMRKRVNAIRAVGAKSIGIRFQSWG